MNRKLTCLMFVCVCVFLVQVYQACPCTPSVGCVSSVTDRVPPAMAQRAACPTAPLRLSVIRVKRSVLLYGRYKDSETIRKKIHLLP